MDFASVSRTDYKCPLDGESDPGQRSIFNPLHMMLAQDSSWVFEQTKLLRWDPDLGFTSFRFYIYVVRHCHSKSSSAWNSPSGSAIARSSALRMRLQLRIAKGHPENHTRDHDAICNLENYAQVEGFISEMRCLSETGSGQHGSCSRNGPQRSVVFLAEK
jgi:hypothetical protein